MKTWRFLEALFCLMHENKIFQVNSIEGKPKEGFVG